MQPFSGQDIATHKCNGRGALLSKTYLFSYEQNYIYAIKKNYNHQQVLHKKSGFPLRISLVNVTKSAGICGFDHIY